MNSNTNPATETGASARTTRRDRVRQAAGVFAIGAAVWGLVAASGGSGLPTIALAGGARETSAAGAGLPQANGTADGKMAIWNPANYEFALADGVDIPAGKEMVYRWDGPSVDEVRALAAKLGVSGELTPLPSDQGEGWQIGNVYAGDPSSSGSGSGSDSASGSSSPSAASDSSMYFVAYATGSFSYYQNVAPRVGCVTPVPVQEPTASSGSGSNTDPGKAPDALCNIVLEPVKNLPTKADAEAKLKDVFGDLTDVNVYADAYSVNASGAMAVADGVLGEAGKQWVSLSFGENKSIVGAYGMLGRLEKVGEYPTISASDAVARLAQFPMVYAMRGVGGGAAGSVVNGGAGVDVAPSDATTDTVLVDPVPVDSVPGGDTKVTIATVQSPIATMPTIPVPGAPGTTVPVPTITVRLVKVTKTYQMVWDTKGVMWVVPSYEYTDSDGGLWNAYAVNAKYLSLPQIDVPQVTPMEGGPAIK